MRAAICRTQTAKNVLPDALIVHFLWLDATEHGLAQLSTGMLGMAVAASGKTSIPNER